MKIYVAIALIVMFFVAYAIVLRRLRNRRIGPAAVGTFYDMLEHDKQKGVEIVVDEKTGEEAPDDADDNPPQGLQPKETESSASGLNRSRRRQ